MAGLVIVGGGPAGCAAAVMAASLGLPSILVEPAALGHKLTTIGEVTNVLGGAADGAELARRLAEDVSTKDLCKLKLGRRVIAVRAEEEQVAATLDDGEVITAPHAIVATGVRPQRTGETGWITQDREPSLPVVWQVAPSELDGAVVLGVDRPLGTVLRTHATVHMRLTVLYHPDEEYKSEEIARDPRVTLIRTRRLELAHEQGSRFRLRHDGGEIRDARVCLNLGGRPVAPDGDLVRDADGYCPPDRQHPRVLIAGDLRGPGYQRIMTAYGEGAEAALTAYYASVRR